MTPTFNRIHIVGTMQDLEYSMAAHILLDIPADLEAAWAEVSS